MELKIETTQAVKTAEDLIKGLELIEITTDEQYETSNQLSREVAIRIRSLDTMRKSITKPIDEAKRKVMDLFRPVQEKLIAFADMLAALEAPTLKSDKAREIRKEACDSLDNLAFIAYF